MRIGGTSAFDYCDFLSNSASTRGLAVAVVGSVNMNNSLFSGNEMYCASGSYNTDTEYSSRDAEV